MAVSPLHKPVLASGMQIVEGVDAACATSVGPRHENQDRCALGPGSPSSATAWAATRVGARPPS